MDSQFGFNVLPVTFLTVSEEDSGAVLEDKPSSPRRKTTSEETINHLAYPDPQPSQCHSKVCDARSVKTLTKSGS